MKAFTRSTQHAIEVAFTRLWERQAVCRATTDEIVAEVRSFTPHLTHRQIVRSLRRMDDRRDSLPFIWEEGEQGCGSNVWRFDIRLAKCIRLAYAEELEPPRPPRPANER